MAAPKIFVSSTCYDLQEVRITIHDHIKNYGYEPVMSDYDDIFYHPDLNVQDACISAISNCNMFILVIGNKYGTTYYQHQKSENNIPNSVTLQEFSKAISLNIPKIILLNKWVHHDYRNYRKVLEKKYTEYFNNNSNSSTDIESIKLKIKMDFDNEYHFPESEYKYIFYFLDKIKELQTGNAFHEFENSKDIQKILIKQWAGYMTQSLTWYQNKFAQKTVEQHIDDRIQPIEKLLVSLADTMRPESNSSKNFIELATSSNMENIQNIFDESMQSILYEQYDMGEDYIENIYYKPRLQFTQILTISDITSWVNNLQNIFNSHKWSKTISIRAVFENLNYTYWKDRTEISINQIGQLSTLYENCDDKDGLIKTIKDKFEPLIDYKVIQEKKRISEIEIPF